MAVYERNHHFSQKERVLNLDDLLSYDELNPATNSGKETHPNSQPQPQSSGKDTHSYPSSSEKESPQQPQSEYLVGPKRDMLKIHIVIEPLNDLLTVPVNDNYTYTC